MTLSIKDTQRYRQSAQHYRHSVLKTHSMKDSQNKRYNIKTLSRRNKCYYVECRYAGCCGAFLKPVRLKTKLYLEMVEIFVNSLLTVCLTDLVIFKPAERFVYTSGNNSFILQADAISNLIFGEKQQ